MQVTMWSGRKFLSVLGLWGCLSVLHAGAAYAAESEFRIATAWLSGQSGEYVYDAYGDYYGPPGYKVSELQWQLDNVLLLGVGGTYHHNEGVRLNLDIWLNMGDGDGVMDDYDWLIDGMDWTHWSHHDNTLVTDASKFDLNGDFTLYRNTAESRMVTALVGYRQDRFGWESRGGYALYSTVDFLDTHVDLVGFRDTYFSLPNTPVINYEQTYRTPYVGLGLKIKERVGGRALSLDAAVRYSHWVHGEDVDMHILRDLRFETEGSGGTWLEYGLSLSYLLKERLTLSLDYSAQEYDEIRGPMIAMDQISGATYSYPGESAGLDHHSRQLSLGLRYAL